MGDSNTNRVHFMNLDLLRFFAAYMIVILHSFTAWQANWGNPTWMNGDDNNLSFLGLMVNRGVNNLGFGVDIFFLISGFLITYLLLAERERTGTVDVFKFYVRRAFRIWPLYFLLLLGAPLLVYFFNDKLPDMAYHFGFLGNFETIKNNTINPITTHLWSICVEEHFYLICPVILAFVPTKKLPQAFLMIIFCSILFRFYIFDDPKSSSHLYLNTLSRIDTLALGCLFGYLVYFKKLKFEDPLPVRLIIYSIFVMMVFTENFKSVHSPFDAAVKKYLFILPAAYWLGNFIFNAGAKLVPTKENFFHLLGKASYGMYMFNPVLISVGIKYMHKYNMHNFIVYTVLVNAILLGIVLLSYHFFEVPFLKLKEKFSVIPSGSTKHAVMPVPVAAAEASPDKGGV
jgi:peptidoglycan/LPS O-acetylase OafA/YrhL